MASYTVEEDTDKASYRNFGSPSDREATPISTVEPAELRIAEFSSTLSATAPAMMHRSSTTPVGPVPGQSFPLPDGRDSSAHRLGLSRALTMPAPARSFQVESTSVKPAPVIESTRLQAQFTMPVGAPDLVGSRRKHIALTATQIRTFLHKLKKQLIYIVFFVAVDTMRVIVDVSALKDTPQELSQTMVVAQALISLLLGLVISGAMEKLPGVKAALAPREMLRCLPVGVCFMISQVLLTRAYSRGLGAANAQALGYLYMVMSAMLSRLAFGRKYGWLEMHALFLITFASMTFAAGYGNAGGDDPEDIDVFYTDKALFYSILSTTFSVTAAIAMERLMKPKYHPHAEVQHFWIQKVRLEAGTFLASLAWFAIVMASMKGASWQRIYDGWNWKITLALSLRILQAWMAGWLAKHLSTVGKGVIHSLTLIFVYFVSAALGSHPLSLAGLLLTSVIAQAALMYQFGRRTARSTKKKKKALEQLGEPNTAEGAPGPQQIVPPLDLRTVEPLDLSQDQGVPRRAVSHPGGVGDRGERLLSNSPPDEDKQVVGDSFRMGEREMWVDQESSESVAFSDSDSDSDTDTGMSSEGSSISVGGKPRRCCHRWSNCGEGLVDPAWLDQARQLDDKAHEWARSFVGMMAQASCVILFVLADAGRTLVFAWAINGASFNGVSQSVVVAMSSSSVPIGIGFSFLTGGKDGALAAFDWKAIAICMPVAALFSVGQSAQTHAYGAGISATLNTVIGYSYMPLSALLSRFIFQRHYSTLEWLALSLITCSAIVFVIIRGSSSGCTSVECVGSAAASVLFACCGSLAAEKVLKGNCKCCGSSLSALTPFYTQKVHLEVGGTVTAVIMLFVIGALSSSPGDAFWNKRDIGNGVMASGVFVGWTYKTFIALFASAAQSWLGGIVSKRLSTVVRAVAQCMSLIIIYYVGDLMIDGPECRRQCNDDACRNECLHFEWPVALCSLNLILGVQVFAQAGLQSAKEHREETPPPAEDGQLADIPAEIPAGKLQKTADISAEISLQKVAEIPAEGHSSLPESEMSFLKDKSWGK